MCAFGTNLLTLFSIAQKIKWRRIWKRNVFLCEAIDSTAKVNLRVVSVFAIRKWLHKRLRVVVVWVSDQTRNVNLLVKVVPNDETLPE